MVFLTFPKTFPDEAAINSVEKGQISFLSAAEMYDAT